jgi:hypothetical protein
LQIGSLPLADENGEIIFYTFPLHNQKMSTMMIPGFIGERSDADA